MSIELDKKIGTAFFGWTEERTEENNWFDVWVEMWRPRPTTKNVATPAYSTSLVDAMKLVEQLFTAFGIETAIIRRLDYFVYMTSPDVFADAYNAHLPTAIGMCAQNIIRKQKELPNENLRRREAAAQLSEIAVQV